MSNGSLRLPRSARISATSRLILTGKVHDDHLVSALAQLRSKEMPMEGAIAGTVDEDIGRHQRVSQRVS
jgi:hypothetical protein